MQIIELIGLAASVWTMFQAGAAILCSVKKSGLVLKLFPYAMVKRARLSQLEDAEQALQVLVKHVDLVRAATAPARKRSG
jgi:hypothetical protein